MGSIAFPSPGTRLPYTRVDRCMFDLGAIGVSRAMRFTPTRVFPSSVAFPCHSPAPSEEFACVSPGSLPSCRRDCRLRSLPYRPLTDGPSRRFLNLPSTSGPCSTAESVAPALRYRPACARSSLGLCSTSRPVSVPRCPCLLPFAPVLSHRRSWSPTRLIPLAVTPSCKQRGVP